MVCHGLLRGRPTSAPRRREITPFLARGGLNRPRLNRPLAFAASASVLVPDGWRVEPAWRAPCSVHAGPYRVRVASTFIEQNRGSRRTALALRVAQLCVGCRHNLIENSRLRQGGGGVSAGPTLGEGNDNRVCNRCTTCMALVGGCRWRDGQTTEYSGGRYSTKPSSHCQPSFPL